MGVPAPRVISKAFQPLDSRKELHTRTGTRNQPPHVSNRLISHCIAVLQGVHEPVLICAFARPAALVLLLIWAWAVCVFGVSAAAPP